MISNYNAGKKICLEYFLSLTEVDINLKNKQEYVNFIQDFHHFNTTKLFQLLYIEDKANFINAGGYRLKLADADLNFAYRGAVQEKTVVKIKDFR